METSQFSGAPEEPTPCRRARRARTLASLPAVTEAPEVMRPTEETAGRRRLPATSTSMPRSSLPTTPRALVDAADSLLAPAAPEPTELTAGLPMSLTIAAEEAATVDVDAIEEPSRFALRVVPRRAACARSC